MNFIASVLVNWRWSPEGEDLVELLLCNCSVLLQQMKNPPPFCKELLFTSLERNWCPSHQTKMCH